MNLVLFEPAEIGAPLPRTDRRAKHVLEVLRRTAGDTFDAGVINGPRGKATLTSATDTAITFTFAPANSAVALAPLILIAGLPRPQTARDILRDATTLGVRAIHFVLTEKSDRNYVQSSLWSTGEWRRHVIAGAEQAFDTQLPDVTFGIGLAELLRRMAADCSHEARLALDNYETALPLADVPFASQRDVALAIGPERGWTAIDREHLRRAGFTLVHLGPRIMRVETAVIAALTLVHAGLGRRPPATGRSR